MLALFLSLGGACALLLVLWVAKTGSKTFSEANLRLREVDVAAFRNLLSAGDDEFLKHSLKARHYQQVRRARLRATQEYLGWIAGNCAVLLRLLRSTDDRSNTDLARDIPALAQSVVRLRLIAVGLWFLLWVEYLVPNLQIRPLYTIRKYEELWRTVEMHLDAIVPHSTVVADHSTT
jgi:hypothetical protein